MRKSIELYGIKFKPSVYAYENNLNVGKGECRYYFTNLEEAERTLNLLSRLYKQYDYVAFIVPNEQKSEIGRKEVVETMEEYFKKSGMDLKAIQSKLNQNER